MDKKRVLVQVPKPGSMLMTRLLQGLNAVDRVLTGPFLLLIAVWRRVFAPLLGPRCRFYPSCSHYAAEALREHGFLHGTALLVQRLARCNPLFEGGFDPVPPKKGLIARKS